MGILIAFLVMLAVAIVAGVLLTVFSVFFAVPENPQKKLIRECLPGINCGACGFKGCDDYAEALAEGGVAPNLCVPGAQGVANEIGAILGVEAEAFNDKVAFVACNGHCEATFKVSEYEGVSTCSAASMLYGGPNACRFGCLGLGDCAAACPAKAICVVDGIAHVDTSRCLGCGLCARTCPKGIINMVPQQATSVVQCSNKQKGADARKVCTNACIGCKRCEKDCPGGAIKVIDNLAVIDYEKCTHCGACIEHCPTGCLKAIFFPDLPEGTDPEDLLEVDHANLLGME